MGRVVGLSLCLCFVCVVCVLVLVWSVFDMWLVFWFVLCLDFVLRGYMCLCCVVVFGCLLSCVACGVVLLLVFVLLLVLFVRAVCAAVGVVVCVMLCVAVCAVLVSVIVAWLVGVGTCFGFDLFCFVWFGVFACSRCVW